MTRFFVLGKCVPWSVSRRGTKHADLTAYQQKVAGYASSAGCKPTECAVRLQLEFVLPRPKRCKTWYPTGCDLTNLLKGIEDGLKGVAWVDDRQVQEGAQRKRYVVGDEEPGINVEISHIKEPVRRTKRTNGG